MNRQFERLRSALALMLVCTAGACGDPDTRDGRGYTKAPLEAPGVFIRGEREHPMRSFGEPNLPRPIVLEMPVEAPEPTGAEGR